MMPSGEQDREIISTPIGIRNDRAGLHTSPTERRSFDISPLQSDTGYEQIQLNS